MTKKASSKHGRKTKKELVLGTPRQKRNPLFIILPVVIVAAAAVVAYMLTTAPLQPAASINMSEVNNGNGTADEVRYPLSLFADGQARFFEQKSNQFSIRYFILKSSDGVVRAAFDACDVCWPAGKGYVQDGDEMVCRNCGRRFASVLVNVVQGGCNPAPLNRSVQGDQLVIRVNDIVQGQQYFNLKART